MFNNKTIKLLSVTAMVGIVSSLCFYAPTATTNTKSSLKSQGIINDIDDKVIFDYTDLELLADKIDTTNENVDALGNKITANDTWSDSKSYEVGDLVIKNGQLYKCSTANTAKDPTVTSNSTYWEATSVGEQMTEINSTTNKLNENLTFNNATAGITNVPFKVGVTDDGKYGYILNQGGADTVIPFSGGDYVLLNSLYIDTGKTNGGSRTLTIPNTYTRKGVFVLCQDDSRASGSSTYGATINTTPQTSIFSHDGNGVSTKLAYLPNITGGNSVECSWRAVNNFAHYFSVYIFSIG